MNPVGWRPELPTIEDLCRYLQHLQWEIDTVALLIVRLRAEGKKGVDDAALNKAAEYFPRVRNI